MTKLREKCTQLERTNKMMHETICAKDQDIQRQNQAIFNLQRELNDWQELREDCDKQIKQL